MRGSGFVFINLVQALRFGHVGWGFALDEAGTRFYFGSTDHLYRHPWWDLPGWIRYANVPPQNDVDWWSGVGTREEMYRAMFQGEGDRYHIWYHCAKEIEIDAAAPEAAVAVAESLRVGGWALASNNCVHQAFNVLSAYGAKLPAPGRPLTNLIPKVWFEKIDGRLVQHLKC